MEQIQEKTRKSVYTFRTDKLPNVQISFELESSEENEELRDSEANNFLNSILNSKFTDEDFYQDDIVDIEE